MFSDFFFPLSLSFPPLRRRYFLFVLLPMCRQTVETQRGKNTKNERARKQCPIASDNNQTWRDIGIERRISEISQKNEEISYWVRRVKAADVMDDGRCRPLMISCHSFLLMTSTSPPRATTRLYNSYKSNTCLAMIGKRVIGVPAKMTHFILLYWVLKAREETAQTRNPHVFVVFF